MKNTKITQYQQNSDILKGFKIETSNKGLYKQAFTHSSYINEKKSKYGHYERLEFIGDGVLDLVIADLVFKAYPKLDQGELSKLRIYFVNGETLTKYAKKYHYDEVLLLGKGQKVNGGTNDKILEDVFEAFLGAVYFILTDTLLSYLRFERQGIHAHLFYHGQQSVASGRRKMILQSYTFNEVEVVLQYFVGSMSRNDFNQQGDDAFHDERIALGLELYLAVHDVGL